ncbi:MAG: hypothetical protein ACLSXM_10845, partial [Turicibacter sanguinis]
YTSEEVSKAAEALTKESLQTRLMTTNIEDLEDVKNAPVVKMVISYLETQLKCVLQIFTLNLLNMRFVFVIVLMVIYV